MAFYRNNLGSIMALLMIIISILIVLSDISEAAPRLLHIPNIPFRYRVPRYQNRGARRYRTADGGSAFIPGIGRVGLPPFYRGGNGGGRGRYGSFIPGGDDTFLPNPGLEVPNPRRGRPIPEKSKP